MNHNVQMLIGLAASGKMTPEQWLKLPPELQAQLLPLLIHRETHRSPKEIREMCKQAANGASWGLFTASMQQLGAVICWLLLIAAVCVGAFVVLCMTVGHP